MLYISEKPFSYILKLDILDYIAVYICWDMNLKINVDNFCIFFFLGVQGIGLQAKYLFSSEHHKREQLAIRLQDLYKDITFLTNFIISLAS